MAHDQGSFRNPIRPRTNASALSPSSESSTSNSEPDFSMMGSGLLGGSNWLPTPQERAEYDTGIEIRVLLDFLIRCVFVEQHSFSFPIFC